MKMWRGWVVLALGVAFAGAARGAEEEELVLVTAMWRHGDRSPKSTFVTDGGNPAASWPSGLSQLTPRGMEQHLQLGKALRSRYESLLGSTYSPGRVYFRSTDCNRTLMSAVSNAAGMFAGTPNPGRPNSIPAVDGWPKDYFPVPIHSLLYANDPLKVKCHAASQYYEKVTMHSDSYKRLVAENEDFLKQLETWTGMSKVALEDTPDIWDVLHQETVHNETHRRPAWATDAVYGRVAALARQARIYQYLDDFRIRLKGGPILQDILYRINRKIDCEQKDTEECSGLKSLRYYAYSAHDTTLRRLLGALGFPPAAWGPAVEPSFAACLLIELWRLPDSSYALRFFYKDGYREEMFHQMVRPQCGATCPLDTFTELSKKFIPKDEEKECKSYKGTDEEEEMETAPVEQKLRVVRNSVSTPSQPAEVRCSSDAQLVFSAPVIAAFFAGLVLGAAAVAAIHILACLRQQTKPTSKSTLFAI